jgi:hypothetical protein
VTVSFTAAEAIESAEERRRDQPPPDSPDFASYVASELTAARSEALTLRMALAHSENRVRCAEIASERLADEQAKAKDAAAKVAARKRKAPAVA